MKRVGKRMGKRRVAALGVAIVVAIYLPLAAVAWDWPMPEPLIAIGFGQSLDYGGLSTGVLLRGSESEVYAAHEGEVVYRAEERSMTPGQLTHPLGNLVVAEHGRSFRAVYGHLDTIAEPAEGVGGSESEIAEPEGAAGSAQAVEAYQLSPQVPLGRIGASGFSTEPGLLLQIRDQERDAYVNPEVMLPQRNDEISPVAQALFVQADRDAAGPVPIDQIDALPRGTIRFYVAAYDVSPVGGISRRVAPYRIDLFVDGEPADTIQYETVTAVSDGLRLAGRISSERVSASTWQLYAGSVELEPGTYPVAVAISDYAGNRTQLADTVTVTGDE